jgi:hypothetical protein
MYFWPEGINDMSGIQRQMASIVDQSNGVTVFRSVRNAPQVQLTPAPHLVNDGKSNTIANEPGEINARRQAMLAYLRPAWA